MFLPPKVRNKTIQHKIIQHKISAFSDVIVFLSIENQKKINCTFLPAK